MGLRPLPAVEGVLAVLFLRLLLLHVVPPLLELGDVEHPILCEVGGRQSERGPEGGAFRDALCDELRVLVGDELVEGDLGGSEVGGGHLYVRRLYRRLKKVKAFQNR
jgi:hypothetical protein